jgi:hypothetical protein
VTALWLLCGFCLAVDLQCRSGSGSQVPSVAQRSPGPAVFSLSLSLRRWLLRFRFWYRSWSPLASDLWFLPKIEFLLRETRGCQFFIFCIGLAQLDCLRSSINFSSRQDYGPDFISSVASEALVQPPPAFFFFRAEFFVPNLGLPSGISLRCYFGPAAGSFCSACLRAQFSAVFYFSIRIFAAHLGQLIHFVSSQSLALGISFRLD